MCGCVCVLHCSPGRNEYSLAHSHSLPPFRGPLLHSLEEVLMHLSQSEVFEEGISCALFKLAELGEVSSAEILLRYGANFHFEGDVKIFIYLFIYFLGYASLRSSLSRFWYFA